MPLGHQPIWILSTVNKTVASVVLCQVKQWRTFPLQPRGGGHLLWAALLWLFESRVDHGQPLVVFSPQLYLWQLNSCVSLLHPREKSPSLKLCLCSPLSTFVHCTWISVVWSFYVPVCNFNISLTVFSLTAAAIANWIAAIAALHWTMSTSKAEGCLCVCHQVSGTSFMVLLFSKTGLIDLI